MKYCFYNIIHVNLSFIHQIHVRNGHILISNLYLLLSLNTNKKSNPKSGQEKHKIVILQNAYLPFDMSIPIEVKDPIKDNDLLTGNLLSLPNIKKRWNHYLFLRFVYTSLINKNSLEVITFIMDSMKTFQQDHFHYSINYFWIQIINYYRLSDNRILFFYNFILNNPCLENESLFLEYFSLQLIFNNPKARELWCRPDKKPLPTLKNIG